jgi:hypothetical protein
MKRAKKPSSWIYSWNCQQLADLMTVKGPLHMQSFVQIMVQSLNITKKNLVWISDGRSSKHRLA